MTSKEFIQQCKESRDEHKEQKVVNSYCNKNKILMFAIPNGANKSKTARGKFNAEGLKAGVPDLFIPIANKYYHGLFIEMKRRPKTLKSGKKSYSHIKVSENQKVWLQELRQQNYEAVICYGSDEAIDCIDDYMLNVRKSEEVK